MLYYKNKKYKLVDDYFSIRHVYEVLIIENFCNELTGDFFENPREIHENRSHSTKINLGLHLICTYFILSVDRYRTYYSVHAIHFSDTNGAPEIISIGIF